MLNSDQVHRIYLDELGDLGQLPVGIGLMVLTTVTEAQAPEQARTLLARTAQEVAEPSNQQAIMELITTIMVYRFTRMSRQEVEAMLGLQLQDTRVYQEAKEEGRQEGRDRQVALLLKQLQRKLGEVPSALILAIRELDFEGLERLGESIFDLESYAQVAAQLVIAVDPQTTEMTVRSEVLLKLIKDCLGALEVPLQTCVLALSVSQVHELVRWVLEWQSQAELVDWLNSHSV